MHCEGWCKGLGGMPGGARGQDFEAGMRGGCEDDIFKHRRLTQSVKHLEILSHRLDMNLRYVMWIEDSSKFDVVASTML